MKTNPEGEVRRERLLGILHDATEPISGTELANRLEVSRQVIVQDIALLRAIDKNILSTNKGYVLYQQSNDTQVRRTICVCHSMEETLDELYTVVDEGGKLLDVFVEHEIYGQIMVDLIINNRTDAKLFMEKVKKYGTKPLNELTGGVHFHTIKADSEEILDRIENALREKGYL